MAVITVEPVVNYPFVKKGTQTRLVGQYCAIQGKMTHWPRLYVKIADNCNNSYWASLLLLLGNVIKTFQRFKTGAHNTTKH